MQPAFQPVVTNRLHCVYQHQPVVQPVGQRVVSCKHRLLKQAARWDQNDVSGDRPTVGQTRHRSDVQKVDSEAAERGSTWGTSELAVY